MSIETPIEYTQEQFWQDITETIERAKSSGSTNFNNFDLSEPVADSESRKVFKKFVDGQLGMSDVENYKRFLLQQSAVSENQKDILEFLNHQVMGNEPDKAAREMELKVFDFREEIEKLVKESQAKGETHFSAGYDVEKLGITDMNIYRLFWKNEITDEQLRDRAAHSLGFVQKEFAEYLIFLLSEKRRVSGN